MGSLIIINGAVVKICKRGMVDFPFKGCETEFTNILTTGNFERGLKMCLSL